MQRIHSRKEGRSLFVCWSVTQGWNTWDVLLCTRVLSDNMLISSRWKKSTSLKSRFLFSADRNGFLFSLYWENDVSLFPFFTHRLSSVSLFAGWTNRAGSTGSAWSTRSTSRTGVTTITLQHREHNSQGRGATNTGSLTFSLHCKKKCRGTVKPRE